jgi:hypothetical protein
MSAGAGRPTLVLRHRASGVWIADGWVWPGAVPDLREADAATWRQTLGAWLDELRAAAERGERIVIVGSQGGLGSVDDLRAHAAYLDRLTAAVARAVSAGQAEADARPALEGLLAADAPALDRLRHALNAQRVWREIEDRSFGR